MVAAATLFLLTGRQAHGGAVSGAAPGFTLPSTDGRAVSLASFRGHDVLLYFSEGVGCDACFYQMRELEAHQGELRAAGLQVLPIVVNPAPQVRQAMAQFRLHTPFLIDASERVSAAYQVLGTGMHANLPGHTFVLVGPDGRLRWEMSYPTMFVSAAKLLHQLRPYLG